MELKDMVRAIRQGQTVEGATLEHGLLEYAGKTYRVQGTERIKLIEIDSEPLIDTGAPIDEELDRIEKSIPKTMPKVKKEKKELVIRECVVCGTDFLPSKFNPYLTKCPNCRKTEVKKNRIPAEDQQLICGECGAEFIRSKFQPYLTDGICKKCRRKATQVKYNLKKKEKALEVHTA